MQSLLFHLHGALVPSPGAIETDDMLLQWSTGHMLVLYKTANQRYVLERGKAGLARLSRSMRTVSGGWIGKLVGRSDLTQHLLNVELEVEPGNWLRIRARASHPALLEGLVERELPHIPEVDFPSVVRSLEALKVLGTHIDGGQALPEEVSALQRLADLEAEHRKAMQVMNTLERKHQRAEDQLSRLRSRDDSRAIELAKLRAELHVTSRELDAIRLEPPEAQAHQCPACWEQGHAIPVRLGRWTPEDGGDAMALAVCPVCWRGFSP